ncbi:MAG: hypothetical protein ACM3IJ_00250 [Candidatus Levyibacteriota bacterium]
MKQLPIILLAVFTVFLITPQVTYAQMGMMGGYYGQPTPAQSDLNEEQTMQDTGQKIYQNLQNKTISCKNLSGDDYEKLGEYFMGQSAGSTQNHVYWDQRIQQMMGENGDTQMHIVWGERGSGCFSDAQFPANTPSFINRMMSNQNATGGGVFPMMGWSGYGWNMTGGYAGFGILGFITWLIVVVDLILAGVWLWQQIRSHKRK